MPIKSYWHLSYLILTTYFYDRKAAQYGTKNKKLEITGFSLPLTFCVTSAKSLIDPEFPLSRLSRQV